jgi:RNA polymerase sigma factor (sigma-70 family)
MLSDTTTFRATDHLIIDSDVKSEVARIVNTLKPRDKRIMVALYGLDGQPAMTLKEVGDEIGVTREMIRQIKEKTLATLKNKLKNSSLKEV